MATELSDYEFALDQLQNNPDLSPEEQEGLLDFAESWAANNRIDPVKQAHDDMAEQRKYEQFREFSSKLVNTPTKRIERPVNPPSRQGQMVAPVRRPSQADPDAIVLHNNAADEGVILDRGFAPLYRGAIASLDFKDPETLKGVTEALIRRDLPDVPTFVPVMGIEPYTRKPMYMTANEDGSYQWALFDEFSADQGDVTELGAALGPILMELGGEMVGGAAGAALGMTKAPAATGYLTSAGAAAGAGVGRALSVPLRRKIAKSMGVPDELIEQSSTSDEALTEGLTSAMSTLASYAVVGSWRAYSNYRHRPLDAGDMEMAAQWEDQVAEARKLVAAVERIDPSLAGTIKLTLGQTTGDANLALEEASLIKQLLWGEVNKIKGSMFETEQAMTEAVEKAAESFKLRARNLPRPPPSPSPPAKGTRPQLADETSESVTATARKVLVEDPLDEAAKNADYAGDALNQRLQLLDEEDLTARYTDVQLDAWKRFQAVQAKESAQWDGVRELGGWDVDRRASRYSLDNTGDTDLKKLMEQWQAEGNGALLATLRKAKEAALVNAGYGPADAAKMAAGENQLQYLAQEYLDPHYYHMAVSHATSQLRALQRAGMGDGVEAHDYRKLVQAMNQLVTDHGIGRRTLAEVRRTPTSGPGGQSERVDVVPLSSAHSANFVDAWRNAADTSRDKHQLYDRESFRKLFKTEVNLKPQHRNAEGFARKKELATEMPVVRPNFIRDRVFAPGDGLFLNDILYEAGYNPATVQHLRAGLKNKYAQTVLKNGKFSPTEHSVFMKQHASHMEALKIDPSEINSIASFGRANDAAKAGYARLRESLIEDYGKIVADPTSPLDLAESILNKQVTAGQADNILRRLGRHDERIKAAVQDQVLDRIMGTVTDNKYKLINSAQLNKLLDSSTDTLTAVMGKQYVSDLQAIAKVANLVDNKLLRGAAALPAQGNFMSIARSLLGPLSKKQRFLTAAQRLVRQDRAKRITEIFHSPGSLAKFVALKHMTPESTRFWVALGGTGLYDMIDELDETGNLFSDIGWTEDNSADAANLVRLKAMYESGEMAAREAELADRMRPVDAGIQRLP